MITPAALSLLQLGGLAAAAAGLVAAVGLLIWAVIGVVLWVIAHRRGDDAPQPLAADGWFDSLPGEA